MVEGPMYSLAQLSRRVLLGYLVTLLSLTLLLELTVLYPREQAHVARAQSLAIGGFRQYLQLQAESQLSSTEDWAYWDDSYAFVRGEYPEFIDEYFKTDSLGPLRLHGMLISDLQQNTLAAQARDPVSGEQIAFDRLIPNTRFKPISRILHRSQSGWFIVPSGYILVTVAPIKPTDRRAEAAGLFYFFRHFSAQELIEFGRLQGLEVSPEPFTHYLPDLAPLMGGEPPGFTIGEEHLRYLSTLEQQPSILLHIRQVGQPVPNRLTARHLLLLAGITLFPFLGMWLYGRLLIRPVVETIAQVGRRDSEGAPVMMQNQCTLEDLRRLVVSYNELVSSVQRDQQRLQALASTDSLTGLLNRRAFDRSLLNACQRSERLRQPLCLVLLDVDYFKQYNDHYGHPAGDRVLCQLAELLRQQFSRATDRVGRYGGEEFIVLLEAQPTDQIEPHLQALRDAVHAMQIEHPDDGEAHRISISIGAVHFIPDSHQPGRLNPQELVQQADQNLYVAKQQGRDRLVITPLTLAAEPDYTATQAEPADPDHNSSSV